MRIGKRGRVLTKSSLIISLLVLGVSVPLWLSFAQQPSPSPTPLPPTLGLDQGYLEFDTLQFKVKLVKASQTLAALQPKGADGFDFTPSDRLERRAYLRQAGHVRREANSDGCRREIGDGDGRNTGRP